MTDFKMVMTEYGMEVLRTCIAAGTAFPATKIAVGDSNGTSYEPTSDQTALVNQKYVGNIYEKGKKSSELYGKYLYFDMQVPASEGDYVIREAALLDSENNFLAVALYPETPKNRATGTQEKVLIIELQITLSENAYNNITIDDSGTLATREYLTDNYQPLSEKNEADGYAGLNSEKKIPCKLLSAAKLAYETGEVMTDEEIFNQILNYAHSTFDLTLFNTYKIGNPTVTTNGIMTGTGSSQGYRLPARSITNEKIIYRKRIIITEATSDDYFATFNFSGGETSAYLRLTTKSSGTGITATYKHTGTESSSSVKTGLNLNEWIDIEVEIENSSIKVTVDGTSKTYSSVIGDNTTLTIESWINYGNFGAVSIDLKTVELIENGIITERFNKTGIDTIKPDDYSITATIYAWVYDGNTIYANSGSVPTELYNSDGSLYTQSASTWQIVVENDTTYVRYNGNNATYTSGSNITLTIDKDNINNGDVSPVVNLNDGFYSSAVGQTVITPITGADMVNKSWTVEGEIFNTGKKALAAFNRFLCFVHGYQYNSYGALHLYLDTNAKITAVGFQAHIGDSTDHTSDGNKINKSLSVSNASWTKMRYRLEFNYTTKTYTLYYAFNDDDYSLAGTYTATTANPNISQWVSNPTREIAFCSYFGHNLNAFKTYINGNLAYQPRLKIPYTESKTSSKIVNSIYRDRVKDAYEQGYPQRYYTLSDTDFTLPCGEIYGELEQKVHKSDLQEVICIVEQYTSSDANTFCWDLSNGWRIQGARQTVTTTGNMTVPLLKPFANTSYLAFKNYGAGVITNMQDGEGSIFSKTETSFVTYNSTSDTTSFDWFAIGKIA